MPRKRSWMRISLRTLIAAMTIAGIGFGLIGRSVILERQARFHDSEYFRLTDVAMEIYSAKRGNQTGDKRLEQVVGEEAAARITDSIDRAQWHKRSAQACRRAMFRPWEAAFWTESPADQSASSQIQRH